jgi:hypothetical protein
MTLRKDYIQRQFEEFGKIMAVILSFKRDNDWEKFESEISMALQKFTQREITDVEALNETDFNRTILVDAKLLPNQKRIIADLLFEKLNLYLVRNEQENYLNLKQKCIFLYTFIQENFTQNEFDLDVHYKLAFLNSTNAP